MEKDVILSQQNLKIAFDALDSNKSGLIHKDKLMNVIGEQDNTRSTADAIWEEFVGSINLNDEDDSKINFHQFQQAMRKFVFDQTINDLEMRNSSKNLLDL